MLLPLSFHMGALQALAFLYVIGKSGRYGGSIAAILFNTPGTAASAATMQDGFPMTKRDVQEKHCELRRLLRYLVIISENLFLFLVPFILRASQKPLDRPNIFQFM